MNSGALFQVTGVYLVKQVMSLDFPFRKKMLNARNDQHSHPCLDNCGVNCYSMCSQWLYLTLWSAERYETWEKVFLAWKKEMGWMALFKLKNLKWSPKLLEAKNKLNWWNRENFVLLWNTGEIYTVTACDTYLGFSLLMCILKPVRYNLSEYRRLYIMSC